MSALALGLVLAACESRSPVALDEQEAITPAFTHIPAAPFAPTLADQGRLWVCKSGPAGTYTFAASGATSLVTVNAPNPFTLTIGAGQTECRQTATSAGSGSSAFQQVTITETGLPANTAFSAVDVYYYLPVMTGGVNVMTLFYHNRFTDPAFVVNANPPGGLGNGFHADLGVILVYRNVAVGGCTLTQGYWKTHNNSFGGGAPADPTWTLLAGGLAENTVFFLSGQTWFGVFWTAPSGNAYYQLAHQYMAARLNQLSPAAVPAAVQTALDTATGLFNSWTPAQIGALKGNNALRRQFIALAGVLGDYNEGITGPGHCDRD